MENSVPDSVDRLVTVWIVWQMWRHCITDVFVVTLSSLNNKKNLVHLCHTFDTTFDTSLTILKNRFATTEIVYRHRTIKIHQIRRNWKNDITGDKNDITSIAFYSQCAYSRKFGFHVTRTLWSNILEKRSFFILLIEIRWFKIFENHKNFYFHDCLFRSVSDASIFS